MAAIDEAADSAEDGDRFFVLVLLLLKDQV